ncbi:MAG: hypothetical protein RR137_01635 [Odoribacter sp.]
MMNVKSAYQNLKDDLNRDLKFFRWKLFFYTLMKGGVILGFSILSILFFSALFFSFFEGTVFLKDIFYSVLVVLVVADILLFVVYPLVRFLLSYSLDNDILLRQILRFSNAEKDVFLSVYNLAFHPKSMSGDEQLKEAAFVQKYNFVKENNVSVYFPNKRIFNRLSVFLGVVLFFFVGGEYLNQLYADLRSGEEIHTAANEIRFVVANESLNVESGKPFRLKLQIESERFTVNNVFICFGGGAFLMSKRDSLFEYDFEVVNNDIKFFFQAADQKSEYYQITVLPTPVISSYKVTSVPPAYTGLKTEVLINTIDFRVLYGSLLKFEFNCSELDSLYLGKGDHFSPVSLKSASSAGLNLNVRESGSYALYGSNEHFVRKNLLNFTVTCIPDLYPAIQVTEIEDSLRNSVHYFYGVVTDDYGFSDLRFNYSVDGRSYTVVPVPIVRNVNTQDFYFSFDFAEFAGMDKADIGYFFEIFDNDHLSGPKGTRSDDKNYQVPDLNTIFDYNVEVSQTVNSSLKNAEKLAGEIVAGVKELQKKMLDNNVDNWEKQQLVKDIVDKKDKLDKLLNAVKESNLKKSDLNKSFTGQDSVLIEKQKQIQSLLDKVMDSEMKKLMEEFSKLSNEFSKDKFKELDEKMKLSFDQMSEELDRNIELLKRFQIEERHDLLSKQLEKLKANQEKLDQKLGDRSSAKDSVATQSKEIKENMENIKKNYQDLLKNNADLSEPFPLDDLKSDLNQLSQEIDQQDKNIGDKKENKKLSEQIKKDLKELSDKIEKQQEKNFMNKSLPENDIELIIQNILIISLSQEEIMKQFSNVQTQSLKYNELGRLQDLKRQEYKIVKDSLSALAESNLMLASLLSHKFYDIEIKFGLLSGYIQDNKRGELAREQQFIVSYLNDIALSLTDALEKSKQSSDKAGKKQGSKAGNGKGGKSSAEGKEGYNRMKQFQNGLKKQLEDLVAQMKKGEKGKPLQQGISRMIRENELFKQSINDFISESGSLSTTEKQLLNEMNRLLDENIRDMANYSVSDQLIHRNNMVYNKLLMSEKASKEREEFEEKRKAESANDVQYKRPDALLDFQKKSGLIKTDFQKSDLKLNDYFKIMYNNYYIKLGNE